MNKRWILVALPFLVGLGFDLYLNFVQARNPVLLIRADLGILSFLLGIALSLLIGAGVVIYRQSEDQRMQSLSRAADERRRFLRRLDHELKNPLTAIRAGLANLAESPNKDARQEALESVDAQALRLSRLAADLRKLAELETRQVERTSVDMTSMLQEAFALAQDQAEKEDRRLTLTIPQAPWPLPKVSGDPDLLFLAMHNLMDNALKFTRPGDRVEIRAFEDGSSVVLEVADTGPGIPENEIPHVWEELYRGQSAHGVPGSGLGLPLVRAIAERHNGQVTLRSRSGQGTVFTLRLPAG